MRRKVSLLAGVGAAMLIMVAALLLEAAAPPQNAASNTDSTIEAARTNNLGAAYMNQQLFEKALKAFEQAAALDSSLRIARLNQGIALLNLGRVDPAKQLLEDAVKLDSKDPHAWYNLGLLYKNNNQAENSIAAFRHVIEIDSDDADTWYFLGTVNSQLKQFSQASEAFQHAVKLNPLHVSAQFGMSRAYQQSGDAAQAREHLARFQSITQKKLGAAMSLAYGEQGKYSRVEESAAGAVRVSSAIPVRFVAVTDEVGIASKANPSKSGDFISYLSPGACLLDYDGDGKLDIFLPDNGPQGGMALFRNVGGGKFEDATAKAGLDPTQHGIGCTAGDYDNDGFTDLAASFRDHVLLLHNEKNGTFKDATAQSGIKTDGFVLGLTFVDYDHDGDIDLYLTRYAEGDAFDPRKSQLKNVAAADPAKSIGKNVMWRNNGDGTFTDVTEPLGLSGGGPGVAALGTDYNNDRAVDIVSTGWQKSPGAFENPREGIFPSRQLWPDSVPAASAGVAVLDFDHDGYMDVAFTHWAAPGITLWRNKRGKNFEPVSLPTTNWVRAWGVAAFDYDNDGWVDLVAVGETSEGRGEVKLFRNLGPDGFKDVSAEVGLDKVILKNPRAIITGDYDGDGATDLLITQNSGPVILLRNQGGNKNHWLRLALKGLNDNKSAIGTKVEVFSGANRQKFEIAGSSGYLGQNSTQLTIGLGDSKQADVVRLLWPTGVLQDEIEIAGNREQAFMEIDRRGSSCPTLFVWDGKHYELVADMLGAGVIGHWVAPGERNIARPTEYVKVEAASIHEKDGKLSFQLMEPMEEVVYLDKVQLLAVDHPKNVDVYPNEFFASNPPYPPFKVITSQNARPPAGAHDEHGHDVLPNILAHHYFGDFELLPFKGFTKPHTLELDLGEPYSGGPLMLLLHGEIEYFTATGMYAADQAGIHATAPYVEALDKNGKWIRVIEDMGFPAGLPRTITADLSGRLPRGAQRIRISTNLQIYWDNILIDRSAKSALQPANFHLTTVPLQTADLNFHGYPRQIEAQPPGNVKYKYEEISGTGPYARQAGSYTRYGDVRPLLTDFDDKLVVFGSGEGVSLKFDPKTLPHLADRWARDYFFLANGYEKDMDFYAAEGSTVEPLPFRNMGAYPYPSGESFPLDDAHLNYFLEYNSREVSGNEPRGYSYHYPQP